MKGISWASGGRGGEVRGKGRMRLNLGSSYPLVRDTP